LPDDGGERKGAREPARARAVEPGGGGGRRRLLLGGLGGGDGGS